MRLHSVEGVGVIYRGVEYVLVMSRGQDYLVTTAIKNTMDDAGFAVAEVLVRGDEKGVPDCGDCCESASVEDVIDKLRQGYGLYIVINPGKMEAVKMGDGATNDCR